MGCPEASWLEMAELAQAYGFYGIELRSLRGKLDLLTALDEAFGSPEVMRDSVEQLGVAVVGLNSGLSLLSQRDEDLQAVQGLATWADRVGVPYIRVFDGGHDGEGEAIEVLGEALDWWDRLKRDRQVQCDLIVETHGYLTDSEKVMQLAELRGGSLNLLWDSCHTWRMTGRSPLQDWPFLQPYVRHIHIKDAVMDTSAKKGFRYTLPGLGEVPVLELLKALRRDEFQGPVSLEWEKLWHAELPSLTEAMRSGVVAGWW